ncbi:hypothetical protein [Flavobacterium sp. I3-2]|uniref:hypothetical protein n=1 Tax=Flavobacterium sp. I3-2 TaxID=2748319 RepID=UPI0015B2B183|nr:hypothetical protein [Flavobacterium sp. I3-2]
MNKFKKITLGLLGAALLTTGLYSCSNDNETTDAQQTENKTANARTASSVIKQYYGTDMHVLKTVKVINGDENCVLTKYEFPSNDYIGVYTLSDANGEIEFLIEIDKNKEEIKSFEISNNQVVLISDLAEIPVLKKTNFDLIDAAISIRAEFPVFNSPRFWGWDCTRTTNHDKLTGEVVSCQLDCVYVTLWSKVSKTETFRCNDANGPKPHTITKENVLLI